MQSLRIDIVVCFGEGERDTEPRNRDPDYILDGEEKRRALGYQTSRALRTMITKEFGQIRRQEIDLPTLMPFGRVWS